MVLARIKWVTAFNILCTVSSLLVLSVKMHIYFNNQHISLKVMGNFVPSKGNQFSGGSL